MNYQNGQIYAVRNHANDKVYIGSTTQTLPKRFFKHRKNCTDCTKNHLKLYSAMNELGLELFYIELVENYPCNSKAELVAREGHWVRQYNSFNDGYNGIVPNRHKDEYRRDTREQHRDTANMKHRCEKCGGSYSTANKSKHVKTEKHLSA